MCVCRIERFVASDRRAFMATLGSLLPLLSTSLSCVVVMSQERNGVDPRFYSFRWLTLMLSQGPLLHETSTVLLVLSLRGVVCFD